VSVITSQFLKIEKPNALNPDGFFKKLRQSALRLWFNNINHQTKPNEASRLRTLKELEGLASAVGFFK